MSLRALRLIALAMALVVPLQGMAAVMGGQCMLLGHHGADGSGAAHDHPADADESHDPAAAHAASHAEGASGHSGHDGGDAKDSHCGPCAACCASASIAGPAGFSIPKAASYAPQVLVLSMPAGLPPGGLERPPHSR